MRFIDLFQNIQKKRPDTYSNWPFNSQKGYFWENNRSLWNSMHLNIRTFQSSKIIKEAVLQFIDDNILVNFMFYGKIHRLDGVV